MTADYEKAVVFNSLQKARYSALDVWEVYMVVSLVLYTRVLNFKHVSNLTLK